MTYDPLSNVVDEPLCIDAVTLAALQQFRAKEKVSLLPGVDVSAEREFLAGKLNDLADTLIGGVQETPSKLWVMTQFQRQFVALEDQDTEVREHFGAELEEIMEILSIASSDGLLTFYLGGL